MRSIVVGPTAPVTSGDASSARVNASTARSTSGSLAFGCARWIHTWATSRPPTCERNQRRSCETDDDGSIVVSGSVSTFAPAITPGMPNSTAAPIAHAAIAPTTSGQRQRNVNRGIARASRS